MYIISYWISQDTISASISHWLEGKNQLHKFKNLTKILLEVEAW